MTNAVEVFGTGTALVFPIIIFVIALAMIFFSRLSRARDWIN